MHSKLQGSSNSNKKKKPDIILYDSFIQTFDEERNFRKWGRIANSVDTGRLFCTLKCFNMKPVLKIGIVIHVIQVNGLNA